MLLSPWCYAGHLNPTGLAVPCVDLCPFRGQFSTGLRSNVGGKGARPEVIISAEDDVVVCSEVRSSHIELECRLGMFEPLSLFKCKVNT